MPLSAGVHPRLSCLEAYMSRSPPSRAASTYNAAQRLQDWPLHATLPAEHQGERAVRISFSLPYRCEYGQNLSISGSDEILGRWDLCHCTDMAWSKGDVWRTELVFPASSSLMESLEYKYVVRDQSGHALVWKPGQNYNLQIGESEEHLFPDEVIVTDTWDSSWRDVEIILRESNTQDAGNRSQGFRQIKQEAEDALLELRSVVEASRALLKTIDGASEEAFEADRKVAQASQKAQVLAKALQEAKRRELE